MEKLDYLRRLHDLAYTANLADTDRRAEWQKANMASTHAQPLLDMVESILTPAEYEVFLNCFGCWSDIEYNLQRAAE